MADDSKMHVINLGVVQQCCPLCIVNDDVKEECPKCGIRQHIFTNDPVKEILDLVYQKQEHFNVTVVAHNGRGYDFIFMLREIMKENARWNPEIIRTGTKIMSIKCGSKLRFVDSLNFIPMALSKFPSTFNFEGSKGYFPHFFNTTENSEYFGPLPAKEYYGCDDMSVKDRDAFLKWYDQQIINNVQFDMRREIKSYCVSDVTILRKACIIFRKLFPENNHVDPLQESVTIASACNLIFRRKYLHENSIGIIPRNGYRHVNKQSHIALQWLYWIEYSRDIQIKHSGNGTEVRLPGNLLVDGFCEVTNTVFEFHGCFYHGCLRCFPDQTTSAQDDKQKMLFLRRENTLAKEQRIRALGYNLEIIYECDFRRLLETDNAARGFVETSVDIIKNTPLNPRDSFFGGRTNAVKLHHKAEPGEKILYYDFCSLYPFCNKTKKMPVGHPTIYVGNDECKKLKLADIEGIVKCKVLPPKRLYHPVLPYRCNGKLTFPLCKTCVENESQTSCTHANKDREFIGTFVSDELKKAISLGYIVIEFHEIWLYKVEVYDSQTKTGGVFTEYINNFLKTKQECSGFPAWVNTAEDQDKYIKMYHEKEGVLLDKSKIKLNPGLRYIAKLILNTLWGKFGQRENLVRSNVVTSAPELYKYLNDPSLDLHDLTVINDDVALVAWSNIAESIEALTTVNVAIASYTTANARLQLYEYLEKLGRRVLYFDTDSIIFTYKSGQYLPKTGDFLGEFTNELDGGDFIIEFVSAGPKNYSFRTFNGKIVCKVKGITLNFKNMQTVNFECMKAIICENADPVHVENSHKIKRTRDMNIVTTTERKIYRVSYTKRRRLNDSFDTLPYGYVE